MIILRLGRKLIDAITEGINVGSVKERLDSLEVQKYELISMIDDEKSRAASSLSIDEIKKYLSIGKGIKFKSIEEQRSIISQYVDRVIIHDDHVDIDLYLTPDGFERGLEWCARREALSIHVSFI